MDFNDFLKLQIEEIEKHRWIESEKAGRDLSGIAELDWIEKYAKSFREHIEGIYGPIDIKYASCK